MSIGPNSDLTIDEFVFDPNTNTGKLAMSATRGVMRYIGGGVAWMFTSNISGFAEFRKYDWGTKGFSDFYYPNHAIAQTLDVVGVGLSYNFGGPSFGAAY